MPVVSYAEAGQLHKLTDIPVARDRAVNHLPQALGLHVLRLDGEEEVWGQLYATQRQSPRRRKAEEYEGRRTTYR